MSTVMMRCTGALAVSNAPCVSPASNRRSVATRASGGLSFPPLATRGARVARRHACVSRTRVDGRVRHTTRRNALTDGTRGVSSTTPSPDPNDGDENDVVFGLPRKAVAEPFGILLGSQFVLFVGVGALLPALPLYAQSIGLSGSANGVVLCPGDEEGNVAPEFFLRVVNAKDGTELPLPPRTPLPKQEGTIFADAAAQAAAWAPTTTT